MKKHWFIYLNLAGLLVTPVLHAQGTSGTKKDISKDETVIIRRGNNEKTVIEIKNGSVYINGEPIVTVHDADAAKVHKKVIIENGTDNGPGSFPFRDMDGDEAVPTPSPRHAMLGVLTDTKDTRGGALIREVTPESPAAKAGLKPGDRITRLDGKAIADAKMLSMEVGAQHNVGDKVDMVYERDGKTNTTTATLIAAQTPEQDIRLFRGGSPQEFGGSNMPNTFFKEFRFPGMAGGEDMMDDARPKIGVSVEDRADGAGVTVLSVLPSSAAAKAGLHEGDVITKVGNDKVASAADLQGMIGSNKPGERLSLTYQRKGKDAVADIILPRNLSKRDL